MTLAAKRAEVLRTVQTVAIQDSRTPSDSARQGASRMRESHEIRRREGTQKESLRRWSRC